MTDSHAEIPTPEPSKADESLAQALADLGKNLVAVMHVTWERPERRKLQEDIEKGVNDLGSTLRDGAKAAADNPVSQRIRSDIEDLSDRVRSGQVETKVRSELISALQTLNIELEKVKNMLAVAPEPGAETAAASSTEESSPGGEEPEAASPAPTQENQDEPRPEA